MEEQHRQRQSLVVFLDVDLSDLRVEWADIQSTAFRALCWSKTD